MLLLSQVIWQRAWGCVEGGLGSPCSLVELGADPSAGPLCLGWLQGVRPRRQLSSTSRKQAGQSVFCCLSVLVALWRSVVPMDCTQQHHASLYPWQQAGSCFRGWKFG